MQQLLHLDKLRQSPVDTTYFPYCQVDQFVNDAYLPAVLKDFPQIDVRGSVPPQYLKYGPYFQTLLDELMHDDLRNLIAEKFDMDLSHTSTLITVRGKTTTRDGYIHTDTSSKLVTLLFYFNAAWAEQQGNLRLLKNGERLDDYFEEVIPSAGKLLAFKVTDNCWHGHYPFIGKRQTIQLNYVVNQQTVERETKKHGRSYRLKQLGHRLGLC